MDTTNTIPSNEDIVTRIELGVPLPTYQFSSTGDTIYCRELYVSNDKPQFKSSIRVEDDKTYIGYVLDETQE